jgi:hypothetical protein
MTTKDLQALIGDWAEETFPEHSDLGIVLHTGEEYRELLGMMDGRLAVFDGAPEPAIAYEDELRDRIADLLILLFTLAHRNGIDVAGAVLSKHDVNKGRRWAFDPERGYTRHVEEDAADPVSCRVCGCTEDDCSGCVERTGEPCHWAEPGLCSACVGVGGE